MHELALLNGTLRDVGKNNIVIKNNVRIVFTKV